MNNGQIPNNEFGQNLNNNLNQMPNNNLGQEQVPVVPINAGEIPVQTTNKLEELNQVKIGEPLQENIQTTNPFASLNQNNMSQQVPVMPVAPVPTKVESVNEPVAAVESVAPIQNQTTINQVPVQTQITPNMVSTPGQTPMNSFGNIATNNLDPRTLGRVGAPIENDYMEVQQMDNVDNVAVEPNLSSMQPLSPEMINPQPVKKKGMNKIVFLLLMLILIGGVAYGVYYYLSLGNAETPAPTPPLTTKDITININEEMPTAIEEYATFGTISAENCTINNDDVKTSVAGKYEFKLICGADEYKGQVEVIDADVPKVETKVVTATTKSTISAEDFIISCSKDTCSYAFVNEEEVTANLNQSSGEFDIEIEITDGSGNKSKETVKLIVTAEDILAYLNVTKDLGNHETLAATYKNTDIFPIGNANIFVKPASRNYIYTITSADEYTKVKSESEGKTEFDGMSGYLTFDDNANTITLRVPLESATLDLEYGTTFPTNYSEIRSYYEQKGYTVGISPA